MHFQDTLTNIFEDLTMFSQNQTQLMFEKIQAYYMILFLRHMLCRQTLNEDFYLKLNLKQ